MPRMMLPPVAEMGWAGRSNGELLDPAKGDFEVFIIERGRCRAGETHIR